MGCSGSKPSTTEENPLGEPKISAETPPASSAREVAVPKEGLAHAESLAIELSEEERSMNGAPEGELFVAKILKREELEPASSGTSRDVLHKTVVPALAKDVGNHPWNVEFDALTAFRSLLVHHASVVTPADLESLVPGVDKAVRNSRSSLARNAILCAEDCFLCPNSATLSHDAVDTLCFCLLDSTASNVAKALRSTASAALEQAVSTGPLLLVAPAVATRSDHKNADVAANAMIFCEKALTGLKGSSSSFATDLALDRLIPALNSGLNAKNASGKKAAKACCVLLSSSLTAAEYDAAVSSTEGLTPLQIEDLQRAGKAEASTRGGKGADAKKAAEEARKAKLKELRAKSAAAK